MFERNLPCAAVGRVSGGVLRVLLLVGLMFAVLPSGPVLAETTIGQLGGGVACIEGMSRVVVVDTGDMVPPGGGTITGLSFQSNSSNAGQQVDLLVLRPTGGGHYSVVGKTGLVTLNGTGIERFPTMVSVQASDVLGLWTPELEGYAHAGPGPLFRSGTLATDPGLGDIIATAFLFQGFDLNELASFMPAATRQLASARLIGVPRTCVRAFTPQVVGKEITSVRWSLGRKRIIGRVKRWARRYTASISLSPGAHQLSVRVRFKLTSHTPPRTFRRTVRGCDRST